MFKKIIPIIFFALNIFSKAVSQETKKWEDSLVISFLQNTVFGDKIEKIKDTINGKIVESKNYYCYKSFSLKINAMTKIYLINFGTFITERPIYTAIIDESNNEKNVFIVGEKKFEEDLEQLNNFFKNKEPILKEEYEIEIVDLFLRCRQGQRKTPAYLH